MPIAGPELKNSAEFGQSGIGIMPTRAAIREGTSTQAIEFLLSYKQNEKYLVAVSDANTAAPIILETGEAVMAVGGYSGSDNIMTVGRLELMVKKGEIRYFYIGDRGGFGGQSEITNWVTKHDRIVSLDDSDTSEKQRGDNENFAARENNKPIIFNLVWYNI